MKLLQNKPLVIGVGVVAAAVVAWLVFGIFGLQTLFIDNEVAEGGPVFASGADDETDDGATDTTVASDDGSQTTDVQESQEFQNAVAEAEENPSEVEEETMPGDIVTVAQGSFTGDTGHNVEGSALVLNDGTEQRFLRLEQFDSTNGPDLNVYLRADDGEFIDLGDLKGNIGDQNYEIPTDVDLERFNTVQIWCVRFGVLFGDAVLA